MPSSPQLFACRTLFELVSHRFRKFASSNDPNLEANPGPPTALVGTPRRAIPYMYMYIFGTECRSNTNGGGRSKTVPSLFSLPKTELAAFVSEPLNQAGLVMKITLRLRPRPLFHPPTVPLLAPAPLTVAFRRPPPVVLQPPHLRQTGDRILDVPRP